MVELILDMWRLLGRTACYPKGRARGFLNPIYKKGEVRIPANHRPLCMLSSMRKIVEAALADKIGKRMEVNSCQFGFQKGLSPTVTLFYVDATLKME